MGLEPYAGTAGPGLTGTGVVSLRACVGSLIRGVDSNSNVRVMPKEVGVRGALDNVVMPVEKSDVSSASAANVV